MLNISSQMSTQMQLSLLNERGSDLHTGLSSAYSSKLSDGQWMEKTLIFKEEQEASVTTQGEDKDGVNQCSICLKKFAYPSKLARHILSHTNIRPFKCHMCLKSFQFRWHLQCHVRIHKKKGRNVIAGHLDQDSTVSFSNVGKSILHSATVHKDENMVFQKISGDCSDSDVYLQDTLTNEDLDLRIRQSSAYSSKPSEGRWKEENQESEEEQEASVTTQTEDNDVNPKVLQSKSRNRNKRVYECPVCLKRFGAPSKLKRHCLIHTDQRPFQCSICFRGFRERSHLKVHLRTHTNPSSSDAVTPAGKGIFPVSKSSDRICTLRRKKKSGYQCKICLKHFSFPSKLTRHLFVHIDVKAYTCTICKKSFKQAYYLHKHLKIHTGKINYNSRLCRVQQKHGAKSPTPEVLKGTNNCKLDDGNVCLPQILDSLETKKHRKPECRSKLNLNVQLMESNSSTIEIKTSDALKNTEEQITTSSPIYLKHKQKGVNQCSICLKSFVYPSKLARHILSHTNIRPFKCHICLKSFQFRWHLQCHVRIHKKRGRNIIAGHLEEDRTVSFSNAGKSKEQDVHISSQDRAEDSATVHQDRNIVKENMMYQKLSGDCSDSDVHLQETLLNKGDMDLHTGQSSAYSLKPSDGQWMEKKLIFEDGKEASVTTQSEDKDGVKGVNQCSICLKKFAYPSKLTRHILSHTNIRPFKCHLCMKSFQFRWHLQCHVKIHKKKGRNIIASHLVQDGKVSFSNAGKSKEQDVHTSSQDRAEDSQDENMLKENIVYKKSIGDCSNSDVYLKDTVLNEGDLHLHTGQSSAYSSKPSDGQWMEKNTIFEEEQEASVTTQSEHNDVNAKLLKSESRNKNERVYECPVCLKRFGAPSKLNRHCLIHTDQRPFQCSICFRGFRERSHLKVHLRTHTNRLSPNAVTPARKGIFPVSKSSDRLCMLQRKKKGGYQCEICLKNFSFPSKLTRHLFVHFDDKAYTCTICRKSFKQAYYLHKHLKVHTGKRNNNSRLCRVPLKHGAQALIPGALEGINNFTPDGGNVPLPQILDSLETKKYEKPESRSKLNQNVQMIESNSSTVEIKSSDALKCTEEQITTSSPIYLKCKEKGVNQCSICLKCFAYPSKLARHILSHTDIRPFKCHVCLKSFQFRWHLQCHVRIHKNKGRNMIAGHSEQDRTVSFSNTGQSKEQEDGAEDPATIHQDQNVVMESQKMSVDSSDSLRNKGGLDLHTGQGYAYTSKPSEGLWMNEIQQVKEEEAANVTIQSEDTDVNTKVFQSDSRIENVNKRMYGCPVCHKRFGAPSELKRHCRIHTNQRPFQCSICCRAFRERSNLKVHIRIHNISVVKRRTTSLQSYRDNSVPCNQASKSKSKSFPKQLTAQDDEKSTLHQDQNMMITGNRASQKISGDCSNSDAYLQDSLPNEGGLDLYTGKCFAYSSKPLIGQWMEKKQESEEKQEAGVTTQSEDNNVNPKVLQSRNSNGNTRVYNCPVCCKQFGAPSKLKKHCLIHTNQRPFQCSICCRAFRERSHLNVHLRTHINPLKRRISSLQSYREDSVPCNHAAKSKLKPSPKQVTAQDDTSSTDKQKSAVHQDQKMVRENMASQSTSGDTNDSGVCLQDSLRNEGCLDLHTGQSSVYSSKPFEHQWMEEIQESEEEQEASGTTQSEEKDGYPKVLQSKNSNRSKRVYECCVCRKRFGAPSKLKRHCLIHTNQRPFQCSICSSAFRERSHLKVHIRAHTNPVKRRTSSLRSYKDNSVPCNRASKSRFKPSPKQPTAQDNTKSTVHHDKIMVKENMASQKTSSDYSDSDVYLQDSLLNEGGMDLHTGQSSVYSSKPSEGQWMEEIQESEEEQEASGTTQSEEKDGNPKVLQSKNSNRSKRVYECPVCCKRFGAPSKLKRHCLIHTNQRPFQCSICSSAFRERSHLKVHLRTHTNPVKQSTSSLQSYRDNGLPCTRASKSRLKLSPKQLTAQDDTSLTDKQKSSVHQDLNMVTENMASQKMSRDCSNSFVCLQDSLLNERGLDLHSGQSSVYSSKPSEGQWMEEIQESEEEQEASVTTQSEDINANVKVWQSKNSNRSKRVYECPVCHKRFGAPSKLKRHCLIHTNQRPFQCSICTSAFRERSHLKVHLRTHTNPVKQSTSSLQSYRDNSLPCTRASKSRSKPSPKQLTAQNDTSSTDKQKSLVHQDLNMVTKNMASQKMSGDCSNSFVCLQDSLLNERRLDLHSGQSYVYSSKPSEGQWMEEVQESEEEQEASVATQSEDNNVNPKVLQSRNSNGSKRVYDCPVCHKRFGAPSKLKRHCLIHTNQRPFQCSICCSAFRERSHLKVHLRTHTNPVKRRTSLQSYNDNSVPCNQASRSRFKPSPKQLTSHNDTSSMDKQKSKVHQDLNMVTENMASQKIIGDCSDSDACLQDSLLNEGGLDLHSGQSSVYSSKTSEGQWMEEIQESEEEQGASVTTQSEDINANVKVWQSKNSNRSKRVYECPVCHKRFGAPSKLKRHCLIHTNQRPFQCSICCSAFRERSHLKTHFRTMHQDQNMVTEDIQFHKNSDSDLYFSKSTSPLENVENKSKVVFQCNNKSVWALMHKTDILLDGKKTSDIVPFGRVNDCPPRTDSSLRHCASESRTEENWPHHIDDIKDCDFVDSDTGKCVPDSSLSSPGQYQQKPDVPALPEVVVELEDFDDPGECFPNPPHDLPVCPDCSQCFATVRDLYAHNCAKEFPEAKMKKSHQCDICFKFFNAPSKLKRHWVTHTGQRPFKCTRCQKSFTQPHHLKTHMQSHR